MRYIYLLGILGLTVQLSSCGSSSPTEVKDTALIGIELVTTKNTFYPPFSSSTYHYAADCGDGNNVAINAISASKTSITINNREKRDTFDYSLDLDGLTLENDIKISSRNGLSSTDYIIHCLDDALPEIIITSESNSAVDDGFIMVSPSYKVDGVSIGFLLILDNNGVPRYRKNLGYQATDFKKHLNGKYSYGRSGEKDPSGYKSYPAQMLSDRFVEEELVKTIGLANTDPHDFIVTNEGTYIVMAYESVLRDMTEFGLSSNELTRDSIIQEISKTGEVILEWNSWDYLDINDCKIHRWPDDYAHLNSISVSEDNNLVLSFRGCSQIIKIDRVSGAVIWKLNGSDPDLIIRGDPYQEFCGQHTATEIGNNLYVFDNGVYCHGSREDDVGLFSRAVKYSLDIELGYADFQRDYAMNNSYQEYTPSAGSIFVTPNGNWLINWSVRNGSNQTIEEITPEGDVAFSLRFAKDDLVPRTYRAYRVQDIYLPINIDNEIEWYNE